MTTQEEDFKVHELFISNTKFKNFIPRITSEFEISKSITFPIQFNKAISWYESKKEYYTIRDYLIKFCNYTDHDVDILFERILYEVYT